MNRFLQLHFLTAYPPSNLNRDDLGRPKTAKMGGVDRLRISSQSLKRAWRTSDIFQETLSDHCGVRTKLLGVKIYRGLREQGVADGKAQKWAGLIAGTFGNVKKKVKKDPDETNEASLDHLEIEQPAHVAPEEDRAAEELARRLAEENRDPETKELALLRSDNRAVDIALFGRMLANKPSYNVEAACQVAHALSVHAIVVEDDYFTAVDDLNKGDEDMGAAHIGEAGFASALFYGYLCLNRELLLENLQGDQALMRRAIGALVETALKTAPKGKQNSYASRAYASHVLAETGAQQPRTLSSAFLRPIERGDFGTEARNRLHDQCRRFDLAYGPCAESRFVLDAIGGEAPESMDDCREGALDALLDFVSDGDIQ